MNRIALPGVKIARRRRFKEREIERWLELNKTRGKRFQPKVQVKLR